MKIHTRALLTFVTECVHSVIDVLLRVFTIETRSQLEHALRRQGQVITHQLHVRQHFFRLPTD